MKTPAEVVRKRSRKPRSSQSQKLQLPLSRAARKTLSALARELARELSPESRAKLRAFARQHGYRYADALEAAVVTAVNQAKSEVA